MILPSLMLVVIQTFLGDDLLAIVQNSTLIGTDLTII